jgi:3-hydroxybutyryl-CoA dehydrogenase
MQIQRVGVVGAGTMGSGIAEVCARAGIDTIVVDIDDASIARAADKIQKSVERANKKGILSDAQMASTLGNLQFKTSLEALSDRDLVIEAIIEHEDEKIDIFQRLDKVCQPDAILASNTSSIPIVTLAKATSRPDKVAGMHFFNPAPVQPLVEIINGLTTSAETVEVLDPFCRDVLQKHVIHCRDRAGFVVNMLLVPFLLSAIRMLESGFASPEDIDNGMKYGCAHPMGPLELCDLIGLDTIKAVADVLYGEHNEPLYAPPPLLKRMVSAGLLGRKTGRGFFTYDR